MNPSTLEQSVIHTLAYFNIFNYPLTVAELYRYLWNPPANLTIGELTGTISNMKQVELHNGLACLTGRSEIIERRTKAYLESERKYKKRLRYIALLTYLPHVQAIFVVNSLAFQNVHEHSDIDLLIISKPGKIWTTRFFTTTLAKLLGIRPRPNYTKDTLCLSFYLDSGSLHMKQLLSNPNDIYELYWLRHFFPIYDPKNINQKIADENTWLNTHLPNAKPVTPHPLRTITHTWLQSLTQGLLGILPLESFWKWLQLKILPQELKDLSGPVESSVVVLSDNLLKFHTKDPRPEWQRQWKKTVEEYL